jgi:PAS domain S-box-containing protein
VQSVDGGIVYANNGAARVTGFESADEFLEADRSAVLDRFEILDEQGTPLSADDLPGRRALRGEPTERLVRYRIRETGEERWSVVRANPVFDADGGVHLSVSVIRDVTAAMQVEQQARASAALVDGVFSNAPVGLAFWDRDLRYVRVNEALAAMNGLATEDLVGHGIFELFPDLEEQLGPVFHRVLANGESVLDVEIQGAARLWRASFYPVRDAGGIGGVITDVTETRRAEQRVRFLTRASEMLNETLDIDGTLGALADVAVPAFAGHVTVDLYDDGVLRCVGARHADPDKTDMMIQLRKDYPPTVDAHPVQRAIRTGEPQFVPDVQAEAETMAHDERHAQAIHELGNESGIVVPLIARGRTFGAITFGSVPPQPSFTEDDLDLAVELGRRASAALDNALLHSEVQGRAHAAQGLEFVNDGVVLVDEEGIVRVWNPAAATAFRVKPGRAIGRPIEHLVTDWTTLRERVTAGAEPTAGARRAQTLPVEVRGEERWLSISAVRFAGGTVYAFRDMTEERAVEQLKSDFVSTVSHELRTPLAAIYGAALTLQRDDVRLEESQRTGLLDVISSEADRLARIVNDILWASRLDSGQMGVEIESCDASKLTEQVVSALRAHAVEGVTLAVDAPEGLPPVAADPDKLRQVLTNLLDNAVKYSPDGGSVRVTLAQSGNRVRFRVEDEGLGIPPSEQSRIFEKFFRLDPQLTRGVGGTGLGLYICRELVYRMHGRIWVASDGRRGSTFTVELPVAT